MRKLHAKQKLATLLVLASLAVPTGVFVAPPETASAAVFTKQEKSLIQNLQAEYAALDKTPYNSQNLYTIPDRKSVV